jgi:glycosyltransferase involved in cell wall biosynthesis
MINFQAPINKLGYGVAGYNIFKEIIKIHPSAALYPISKPEFTDEYIQEGLDNRDWLKGHCPSVKMWHQNDVHTHIGKGEHIGFPIFELTEFNEEEELSMSHCDRLFVCSQWAKDVLTENNIKKPEDIHVVPLGVDTELFQPIHSKREATIFFNCGKWEKRKGHDVLLECFNRAFELRDNVELWMMCDNPFIGEMNQQWVNLYKNSPLGSKIRIIPRQQSHKDVYNIMRQAHCGVFPARAEGWNLELLEMMACGKEVIATNYSAHTEFCNKDNCYLVDIDELETAHDGVFFSGEYGQWASFNDAAKDQLIEHMRTVHGIKQRCLNHAGIETANKFTWKNSAEEVLNGLSI